MNVLNDRLFYLIKFGSEKNISIFRIPISKTSWEKDVKERAKSIMNKKGFLIF